MVFPDPRGWEDYVAALRSQKTKGYYHGSDVTVAPLGAREIFEGQARFVQLQYLYFASPGTLSWDAIRSKGMLDGIYGTAFQTFLQLTELEWPTSVDHPTVALFLLVCDMAVNPGAGFPMQLSCFETFIEDIDPGIRFLFLCRTVATKCPAVARIITHYSREEYVRVSLELAQHLMIASPCAKAEKLAMWSGSSDDLTILGAQHRSSTTRPTICQCASCFRISYHLIMTSLRSQNSFVGQVHG